MSDLESITRLCGKLGAPPAQAATMAAQLLKRAEQISAARGVTRGAAMAQLLQILVEGRQGKVPPAFQLPPSGSK